MEFLRGTTPWLYGLSTEPSLREWVARTFVLPCMVRQLPGSGPRCNGRLWALAACVMSGGMSSWSLSGCAGAVACVCGVPCMGASGAVRRPGRVSRMFTLSVGAVARAAGAAAACWKAGGEAVLGVPVVPHAHGCVASASMNRSARARGIVAGMPEKVGFFSVLNQYNRM